MRCVVVCVLCFAFSSLAVSQSHGENWTGWRGPRGDGTSVEKGVPTKWDGAKGDNVTWKVEIPGQGHSSPIVWDDQLFVAACFPDTRGRSVS